MDSPEAEEARKTLGLYPRNCKLMTWFTQHWDIEYEKIITHYPDAKFIVLEREDDVAQAVSFTIAYQTKTWNLRRSNMYETYKYQQQELYYDEEKILGRLKQLRRMRNYWQRFLPKKQDRIEITYEQLNEDKHGTISRVADYIGIEFDIDRAIQQCDIIKDTRPEKQEFINRIRSIL